MVKQGKKQISQALEDCEEVFYDFAEAARRPCISVLICVCHWQSWVLEDECKWKIAAMIDAGNLPEAQKLCGVKSAISIAPLSPAPHLQGTWRNAAIQTRLLSCVAAQIVLKTQPSNIE